MRDYSDAHIVVKSTITVKGTENIIEEIKTNGPFRSSISKVNNTYIGNIKDLDIVKPVYNMLEYSDSYSMTSGSLWNY